MAEAFSTHSTCTENVTQAQHVLMQRFQRRVHEAEKALDKLDDVSALLRIISVSDDLTDDEGLARSLAFLAATLTDASLEARKALFQGDS